MLILLLTGLVFASGTLFYLFGGYRLLAQLLLARGVESVYIDNLIFYGMFAAACIVLILFVIAGLASKSKSGGRIRVFCVGVLLACVLLTVPLKDMYSLPFSYFFSIQVGSMNANYEDIIMQLVNHQAQSDLLFFQIYLWLYIVVCMLAPILFGGTIISMFEGALVRITYSIRRLYKQIFYFSALNEHALQLAISITKEHSNPLIVFCNIKKEENSRLRAEASVHGFVMLTTQITAQRIAFFRKVFIFEISEDADDNLVETKKTIQQYTGRKHRDSRNIEIYVFTDLPESEIVLNAIDKKGIRVTMISKPVTDAYQLLYQKPLYLAARNKVISMLIVGAAPVATALLKAAVWCGQLGDDYTLKITLVDPHALHARAVLMQECPELFGDRYNLRFIDADIQTHQFEEVLAGDCADANYIVVALENEEDSITAALYLRSHYLRTGIQTQNEPVISVYIQDDHKASFVPEFACVNREKIEKEGWAFSGKEVQNYNISVFGMNRELYNYTNIICNEIEQLALNAHALYKLENSPQPLDKQKTIASYHISEVNKRASRANVIHIKYKLFVLGYRLAEGGRTDAGTLASLEEVLNDPQINLALSEIEHCRWNAFMRSEGYRGATLEQAEVFRKYTNNSQKDIRARLHACICSWDALKELSGVFGDDFQAYDSRFIRAIPAILGIGGDSRVNISQLEMHIEKAAP